MTNKLVHNYKLVKLMSSIPGVLILENNKTYGKYGKTGKTGKNANYGEKYLYRFRPGDKDHPDLLVPYLVKIVGFSKKHVNKFAVVKKTDNSRNGHQLATIQNLIGDVTELVNFYEYSLWCKGLRGPEMSIKKLEEATHLALKKEIESESKRTTGISPYCSEHYAITIDPEGCKDIDDAFGISYMGHNSGDVKITLTIYITNVPEILRSPLRFEGVNLWEWLSHRVSTVYLPGKQLPMLPKSLSEDRCSLLQGQRRHVVCCDTHLVNGQIKYVDFRRDIIKVVRNYSYDEIDSGKTKDPVYENVKKIVQKLNECNDSTKYLESVKDSHDVIAWLMIHMNHKASEILKESNAGIFRGMSGVSAKKSRKPKLLPSDPKVKNFLQGWNSSGGRYTLEPSPHELLGLESYTHVTSPIRRLPDLLNLMVLGNNNNTFPPPKMQEFYDNWIRRVDYINAQMKSIKRVQIECNFLDYCQKHPETFETEFDGYVVEKEEKEGKWHYVVYLAKLGLVGLFRSEEFLYMYEKYQWKIYHFQNKSNFKQKIRLDLAN